jgi:hypothetical protein
VDEEIEDALARLSGAMTRGRRFAAGGPWRLLEPIILADKLFVASGKVRDGFELTLRLQSVEGGLTALGQSSTAAFNSDSLAKNLIEIGGRDSA